MPHYVVCRKPDCECSYAGQNGKILLEIIAVLREKKEANKNDVDIPKLKQIAATTYQSPGLCRKCGEQTALNPGPTENPAVSDLLSSIELLQNYEILE